MWACSSDQAAAFAPELTRQGCPCVSVLAHEHLYLRLKMKALGDVQQIAPLVQGRQGANHTMIVQCPACSSRYRVNASNIPQTGGKIRCPSCQHAFVVYPEAPAQAPAPTPSSYDEDKTSIASRPDLQQLLHNFQQGQQGGGGGGGQEDAGATEIMSGDALPNFANMFGGGGGAQAQNNAHEGDDGTVEMQNPLAFIQQWEKGQGGSLPEDEEDATQIASPDFDFNTFQPLQAPANPAPARPASPPPSKPAPNPFTAQPAPQQQQPAASPFKPGAFGDDPFSAVATQESPSPFANGANPLAAQGMGGAPAAAPAPVDGPDPNHQGPWKLKTNFGLTYEFVDTQNLLQWMASRDELDGYMLSGHNDQFYPVKDFPQISQGLASGGRTRTSRPANMSTGPIPQVPVGGGGAAPPAFGAGQPAAQGGFGQPMGQGGFGAPPQQPAQRGERVQSGNFQPPSRDAAWNKVLWVVFILLFIGAVGIGLQLSGVVDIKGMVLGTPPAPTTPVTTPTPTPTPEVKPTTPEEPVIEASEGEVDALIKDAKRAIKNNKFISAKEKLQAAKLLAPERPEIYEMLAQVYDEMKQPEEAKAAREKAAALSGKAPEEGGEAKPSEDGAPEEGDKGSEPPSE